MLDNSWKRWVAENKLLGIPDQQIIDTMKSSGISEQSAREELHTVLTSPYYLAANYYTQLLHKRQSLGMIERQLLRLDPKYHTIERKSNLSRADFLEHHYSRGRPVIICDMMHNWKAMTRWNPEYFKKTCGDTLVNISMERDKNPNYEMEDEQHRKTMKFSEYVDMVESAGETNDFYMTARGDFFKDPTKNPEVKAMFDDMEMFPEYLNSNLSCNMWYGPKGSYTPLHHDNMNILLAQVQGRKHVQLIPATEMDLVYNDDGVYSPVDMRNPDYNKYPKLREATVLEFELVPGEALFIPIGWWHTVKSLEKSISVSFTTFVFPNDFTWAHPKRTRPVESVSPPAAVMSAVNADWMKWIDENFRRGCDPLGMIEIMEKSGFSIDAIRQAMGARFPSRHGMMAQPAAETKPVVDHKALAEIPVAQMEWNPGFKRIENGKLQLYTIDNFLTDEECDALVELVDPNVRPSTITVYVEGYRTSYTSDLVNLKSPLVEAMEKKIAMAIGIRPAHSEGIQAQRYDVGQEFKSHTDYFEPFTEEYKIHAGKMGNRTWTFMVYLNECPKGGGTRFVNLDLTFFPKKGQAVVWNNLYPNGKPNMDSMHWGMPIEEGRKYIITKWFRELGEGPMFYNETGQ